VSVTVNHRRCALRRAVAFAFLCAWLTPAALYAAEEEEAELLSVLQQETDIATKTRMNSDFVPGIVTILEGDRLRALGARTVWDAMAYVPGVQTWLDVGGTPTATVRGIPFPFNSGSIQVLLNGSPIFREAAGLNGSVLFVPMAQVERIEFIRGPGSILYGDYAFMGLVNIVTRKQGEEVGVSADSHGGRDVNLLASGGSKDSWQGSLNLAGHYTDDAVLPVNASGDETRFSGIANASYGGFSVQAQAADRKVYAVSGSPPRDEKNASGEARYHFDFTERFGADAHLQYLHNNLSAGGVGSATFRGDDVRSGIDLHWAGWARQNWLAGVEYSDANINYASFVPPPPPGGGPPPPTLVIRDKQRSVGSIYAQDQIELAPTLNATLGARYDDNSEIGERVTPRAALAWQVAEHHILKAQYSEGFRAPTFFELFTPGPAITPLDFEVNRTEEINYVYERPRLTFRATAYHMRIENMVFVDPAALRFGNVAHAKADGAEFELQQQVTTNLRLDANVAYVNSHDNRDLPALADQPIAVVPHWMGNVGLLWNPANDWTAALHWNHLGDRSGAAPQSGKYDLVDVSLMRRALFGSTLDAQVGVSNLFDKRVLELTPAPFGTQQVPYENRTAWVRVSAHW
jgi:iron complex outermembrane receptor protein